jgi:hypothetical protein
LSLYNLEEGEIKKILLVIHSLKVNIVIILHGGGGDNNNTSSNPALGFLEVLLLSPPPPCKIKTIFTIRLDYWKYYYYLPLLHVR